MMTSVSFFSPHSLQYFSLNHFSKAGTKWFHCTMRKVLRFFCAPLAWPPCSGFCSFLQPRIGTPLPIAAPRAAALRSSRREVHPVSLHMHFTLVQQSSSHVRAN